MYSDDQLETLTLEGMNAMTPLGMAMRNTQHLQFAVCSVQFAAYEHKLGNARRVRCGQLQLS